MFGEICTVSACLPDCWIFVLPEYRQTEPVLFCTTTGTSLEQHKNSRGSRMDPCRIIYIITCV